jgi:hypothetical protein
MWWFFRYLMRFFFGNRSFTVLVAKGRRETMASEQVTCALDVVFTHVLAYLRLYLYAWKGRYLLSLREGTLVKMRSLPVPLRDYT